MPGVPYKFESDGTVESDKIDKLIVAFGKCAEILGEVGLGQTINISIDNAEIAPRAVSRHPD